MCECKIVRIACSADVLVMSTFVYLNLVQIRILWQHAATDKVGTRGNSNNCVSLIQLQVFVENM